MATPACGDPQCFTPLPDGESYPVLQAVYEFFFKFGWIIILVLGIPGNILSILITLQKGNRNISTCTYMTALALADTGVLLESIWVNPIIAWSGQRPSLFTLQLAYYLAFTFGILSGFFLAEMTIDRLLAVRYPMQASTLCTTKRAKITVITTFIVVASLNLYIMFTYKFVVSDGREMLKMVVEDYPILEAVGTGFQLVCGTLTPFLIIIFSNIMIIITLRQASKRRKEMSAANPGESHEKDARYLTRMLIFVCVAYVITSIPYRLYELVLTIPEVKQIYKMEEKYWNVRYDAEYWVVSNLWNWNYGINFFLYCVGGGRKYRNDVRAILRQIFCRKSRK